MKVVVEKGSGIKNVFRLHDGVNSLGREVTNRIRLLDPRISRKHCKIRKIGESLFIYDLSTRNGTYVNSNPVTECEIKIDDKIKIGNTILRVVEEDYEPVSVSAQSGPLGFFRKLSKILFGWRDKQGKESQDEFYKYKRPSLKGIWKLPADTDPPEGRQRTVGARTDPD